MDIVDLISLPILIIVVLVVVAMHASAVYILYSGEFTSELPFVLFSIASFWLISAIELKRNKKLLRRLKKLFQNN